MNKDGLRTKVIEVDELNVEARAKIKAVLNEWMAEQERKEKLSCEVSKASREFVFRLCKLADECGEPRRKVLYSSVQVLMDLVVMDGVTNLDLESGNMTLRYPLEVETDEV